VKQLCLKGAPSSCRLVDKRICYEAYTCSSVK
jgi:hypothetical protein